MGVRDTKGLTPQEKVARFLETVGELKSYTRVLLVGDSMAFTLGIGLGYVSKAQHVWFADNGIRSCSVSLGPTYVIQNQLTQSAVTCSVPPTSPDSWENLWKTWIDEFNPDVVVYLARLDIVNQIHNGTQEHIGQGPFDAYLINQLDRAVSIMGAKGAHVVLLTTPYYDSGEQPNGNAWPEDSPSRVRLYNKLLYQVALRNPGSVSVMDLNSLVSPTGDFTSTVDGITIRSSDGVHFTNAGGEWIGPKIFGELSILGQSHHKASANQPLPSPPIDPQPSDF